DEGQPPRRLLEPRDQRRRRRRRRTAYHRVTRHAHALAEADEELGVRDVRARDAARLLLVEALGELDPLVDVGTGGVERAHGARKFPDLEEELHGEGTESRPRKPAAQDVEPEWMATERALGVDRRTHLIDEGAGHPRPCTPARPRLSTASGADVAADLERETLLAQPAEQAL